MSKEELRIIPYFMIISTYWLYIFESLEQFGKVVNEVKDTQDLQHKNHIRADNSFKKRATRKSPSLNI